jgi:DNA-binding NarL/FixJ family response regulator
MYMHSPSGTKRSIRLLIVDDHRMVVEGLRLIFDKEDDLEVVGIAATASEALELLSDASPDVLLTDYRLPDGTGAELATRVRERHPAIHVLFVSMVISNPLLKEAVKAGAQGYLEKTQPAEELVDAVRRAAAGEMLIPAATLAELMAGTGDGTVLLDQLTTREHEILRLLAQGLDNRAIAARLGIGYATVRSHLYNLSTKLGAHSKLEILARAAALGLIQR